jgi:hypothetical protein
LQASKKAVHYSFRLRELGSIENWMEVNELCFTVFSNSVLKPNGTFTITDCKLVEPSGLDL